MGLSYDGQASLWDFQPYVSAREENDRIELGDRVARNLVAASICGCSAGPDAVWAWGSLMFMQVVHGLRPYGKKAPERWMPNPEVLREKW